MKKKPQKIPRTDKQKTKEGASREISQGKWFAIFTAIMIPIAGVIVALPTVTDSNLESSEDLRGTLEAKVNDDDSVDLYMKYEVEFRNYGLKKGHIADVKVSRQGFLEFPDNEIVYLDKSPIGWLEKRVVKFETLIKMPPLRPGDNDFSFRYVFYDEQGREVSEAAMVWKIKDTWKSGARPLTDSERFALGLETSPSGVTAFYVGEPTDREKEAAAKAISAKLLEDQAYHKFDLALQEYLSFAESTHHGNILRFKAPANQYREHGFVVTLDRCERLDEIISCHINIENLSEYTALILGVHTFISDKEGRAHQVSKTTLDGATNGRGAIKDVPTASRLKARLDFWVPVSFSLDALSISCVAGGSSFTVNFGDLKPEA